MTLLNWHTPCIVSGTGPMVGSDRHKKGNSNVRHLDRSADRHHLRRRVHDRHAVRLGRNLAADRLNHGYPKETAKNGGFLINRRDAKVMGVAAGLADYTGIDPLIIRLGL